MSMHPNGVVLMLAGVTPHRLQRSYPDEHTILFLRDRSWLIHLRNQNANRGVSRAIDTTTWEVVPNCSWRIQITSTAMAKVLDRSKKDVLEWSELEGAAPLLASIPRPLLARFVETL